MYGYIYMTTNLVNGRKYIGQKHSSKLLNLGWFYGRSCYNRKCSSETIENTTNEKDIG